MSFPTHCPNTFACFKWWWHSYPGLAVNMFQLEADGVMAIILYAVPGVEESTFLKMSWLVSACQTKISLQGRLLTSGGRS